MNSFKLNKLNLNPGSSAKTEPQTFKSPEKLYPFFTRQYWSLDDHDQYYLLVQLFQRINQHFNFLMKDDRFCAWEKNPKKRRNIMQTVGCRDV